MGTKTDGSNVTALQYLCFNDDPECIPFIEYIVKLTMLDRLKWLGLKRWRVAIRDEVDAFHEESGILKAELVNDIYAMLQMCERWESISLLEEAVWKLKIRDCLAAKSTTITQNEQGCHKKMKGGESASVDVPLVGDAIDRQTCHMSCQADIVIFNVLRFTPLQRVD